MKAILVYNIKSGLVSYATSSSATDEELDVACERMKKSLDDVYKDEAVNYSAVCTTLEGNLHPTKIKVTKAGKVTVLEAES